ncbi:MAG: vitamin B12 dependent-methionine synthase activation domain-containing protein [Acidobacteriota bacterium]
MPVIENIPIRMKPADIRKKMRLPEKYAERGEVDRFVAEVLPLLQPRAVYELEEITHKNDLGIQVGRILFNSRVLARNVRDAERVFPFILTIGDRLEKKAAEEDDLLCQYVLEGIGDLALHAVDRYVKETVCRMHGITRLSSMSPGSLSDWPIEEQKPLFSLLKQGSGVIGVRLTDNLLMLPRKSLSGIYFSTKREFFSCRLCPRENCPGRLAPYDDELKKSYRI